MFCGAASFSHSDDDPWDLPATKKSPRRKHSKNPYAGRGLDKFSTVLAELEALKEKIMARTGPEDVAMVRFVYKNSEDWVPVIVRLPDRHHEEKNKKKAVVESSPIQQKKPDANARGSQQYQTPLQIEPNASDKTAKKKGLPWLERRPAYCWPMALVLVLFCLVFFGRLFAICCTSVWWYLVPNFDGESGDGRKSTKKKTKLDYRRRLGDKKLGGQEQGISSVQVKKVGAV